MKTFKNVGERLTAKDISKFTGFGRTACFKHLRLIKLNKLARRAEAIKSIQENNGCPDPKVGRDVHVFVTDAAEYFKVEDELIRAVLNR